MHVLAICFIAASAVALEQIGQFNVKVPSFLEVFPPAVGQPEALWITQFGLFDSGTVSVVTDIFSHNETNYTDVEPQNIGHNFAWPNKVSPVPPNTIVGVDYALAVPDGFLVPGHSNGGLYIVTLNGVQANEVVRIDQNEGGWFNHMVIWRDMNNDGRLDALTARAIVPINPFAGGPKGELVWLEQPENGLAGAPWQEHVIISGPDFLFNILREDTSAGTVDIVAGEYFGKKIIVATIDATGQLASNYTLDDTIGSGYQTLLIDIDGDGSLDLLANNHNGGNGGDVYVYPGPAFDPTQRITIASGFKVTVSGMNSASPGLMSPFLANPTDTRPSILLAGDGSGDAYLLQPNSTSGFGYETITFQQVGGTVGEIGVSASRPNNFFVPWYEKGIVYAWQL